MLKKSLVTLQFMRNEPKNVKCMSDPWLNKFVTCIDHKTLRYMSVIFFYV